MIYLCHDEYSRKHDLEAALLEYRTAFVVPIWLIAMILVGEISAILRRPLVRFYESKDLQFRMWVDLKVPSPLSVIFKTFYIGTVVIPLLLMAFGVGVACLFISYEAANQFFELLKFILL